MRTDNRLTFVFVLLLGLVAVLASACAPGTGAGEATGSDTVSGGIIVVGQGEAFGQPDQAVVNVGVDVFGKTVVEATSKNEEIIKTIMSVLGDQGIAKEDIQTTNYSLWPEQPPTDSGPGEPVGYHVNNQVSVTVRDINAVGEVLAAAMAAGANSIYGIQFTVSDPAALEADARAAAMADAQTRAASLADLAGHELGEVKIVSEVVSGGPVPMPMSGGMAFAQEVAAQPSISPGQLSILTQVQVTYSIR